MTKQTTGQTVGVIGLGAMGFGMALNAMKAGLRVKAYDISEEICTAFEKDGGTLAADAAAAAADVDILLVMVVNAAQVEDVLFGAGKAAEAAKPGTVVVVCSTVAPADIRRIAGRLETAGLLCLDAPVSGGKVGADDGALTIMASGPERAFETVKPLFDAIAKRVYSVGDAAGLGATYKVVHQLAAGVNLAVSAEVMAFGAHAGCDTKVLYDILTGSAGQSWMLVDRGPRMLDPNPPAESVVDIFVKDLGLVLDAGYTARMPLPLAAAAHQLFLGASAMGLGKLDDSEVIKVYEKMTGSAVARE